MYLGKSVLQHGLYLCVALCYSLPSPGSLCQRSILFEGCGVKAVMGGVLQQVCTHGITSWVEKWSFVSLGED